MEKVYDYEAPLVEIVEVEVEKGYSSSGFGGEDGNGTTWPG